MPSPRAMTCLPNPPLTPNHHHHPQRDGARGRSAELEAESLRYKQEVQSSHVQRAASDAMAASLRSQLEVATSASKSLEARVVSGWVVDCRAGWGARLVGGVYHHPTLVPRASSTLLSRPSGVRVAVRPRLLPMPRRS